MGRVTEGTDSCQLYCYVIFYHLLYESDGHLFGGPAALCSDLLNTHLFISESAKSVQADHCVYRRAKLPLDMHH